MQTNADHRHTLLAMPLDYRLCRVSLARPPARPQKTLGEFLDDATPSPATLKARYAYFDVPHRELFYKEEDLRHFRADGTVIDDNNDNDDDDVGDAEWQDQQSEAAGRVPPREASADSQELGPSEEGGDGDGKPSPPPHGSRRSLSRQPARVRQSTSGPMELGDDSPEAQIPMPQGGSVDTMEMVGGVDLNLNLGAAAFAAASAEYGRSSSSSSGGLLVSEVTLHSRRGDGDGDGGGDRVRTRARAEKHSWEGSGKSSGARSKGSTAAVSSQSSSGGSGGGGGGKGGKRQAGARSGAGGRSEQLDEEGRQEQVRSKGKRRAGAGAGMSGGGAVGATVGGDAPASKRRRVAGGVLVSLLRPGNLVWATVCTAVWLRGMLCMSQKVALIALGI